MRQGASLMVRSMRRSLAAFLLTILLIPLGGAEEERSFTAKEKSWWAIQPIVRAEVPRVGRGWWRTAIDRFVFEKLAADGMTPAPEADRRELVRRAYLDLHGLPPTPEQVDAFLSDEQPKAWERLIDDLLESPHYGERWGQHWLDVVRFAESDGYRQDAFRPDAFRYRDWVVTSLNEDKPYDRFVAQQLAGDEIDADDPDALIGTAYLRNGLYEYNQRDVRFHWELILNELTNVTAEAFLGLGIGCAQCHDHKFDPLLQKDYYRLQAFLAPVRWRHDLHLAPRDRKTAYEAQQKEWEEATREIRAEIDAILEPKIQRAIRSSLIKFPEDIQAMFAKKESERTSYEQQLVELAQIQLDYERKNFGDNRVKGKEGDRLKELRAHLKEFDPLIPKGLPKAFVATDVRKVAPAVPLGGWQGEGDVEPGPPSILNHAPMPIHFDAKDSTGRRLALATWITDRKNPLTARVMVNRIWQRHFGRGLVATPNDFGTLGEEPSHPALLDWLAMRFMNDGWRMKDLHRLIMRSATYRQTALREPSKEMLAKDPENRLLWRYSPMRLDAEQIRDSMLAVSGELNRAVGGRSVSGAVPRRSLYVKKIRNSPDEMLKGFDAPLGFESAAERTETTTAVQSLQLINGPWVSKRAQAMARRVLGKDEQFGAKHVRTAFRLAFGREPREGELKDVQEFVSAQRDQLSGAENPKALVNAVSDLCHALLTSNEFLYLH